MSTPTRVAVITGASSGIGEALARELVAEGYRVALLARRLERIADLADELVNGAIAIQADVTDRESVVAAAARVQHELGGADVVINNAGGMLTAPLLSLFVIPAAYWLIRRRELAVTHDSKPGDIQ